MRSNSTKWIIPQQRNSEGLPYPCNSNAFGWFLSMPRLAMIAQLCLLVALAACSGPASSPVSTRAPAPTFTSTPVGQAPQVDENAASATKAALAAVPAQSADGNAQPAQGAEQPAGGDAQQPAGDSQEAAPVADTPVPPTETPAPQNPEAVISIAQMNVRGGPGLTYPILGGANQGNSFIITGKDPTGAWWEVDYNGQRGWLFGELVTSANTGDVAIAQNIPPAPTPVPVPPTAVPPTPVPAAPAAPAPAPEPAKPKYEFNIAVVGKCEPQAGGTWFSGKTYKNGNPTNGYRVAFSYAPDAEFVTNPILSGPHEGYRNWDAGYYSHIISAAKPRAGTWYIWIVNDAGARISELASFTSDGDTNTCNQAVVDFDSR